MSPAAVEELLDYVEREGANMPRSAREALVLALYRRRGVSGGTAARLLGIPLADFLRLASAEGIAVLDQTPEELSRELSGF